MHLTRKSGVLGSPRSGNILSFLLPLFQEGNLCQFLGNVQEVLVNRLGGLSLPRKSVVMFTDRPDMTLGVYRGRKTTIQQQQYIYMRRFGNINLTDTIFR